MGMHGRKNPNAGRKEIPIDVLQVEALAALGLSEEQIAINLNVSWQTLSQRKRKYIEFRQALARGRAVGLKKVANGLFDAAIGGNFNAQKFYLINRDPANWRDRVETAIGNVDGKPLKNEWHIHPVSAPHAKQN